MRRLAVTAERLAMIGRDDDERVGAGGRDERSDRAIDGGDFAVVRRRGEPLLQIGGRSRTGSCGSKRCTQAKNGSDADRGRAASQRTRARRHLVAAPFERLIPILARIAQT